MCGSWQGGSVWLLVVVEGFWWLLGQWSGGSYVWVCPVVRARYGCGAGTPSLIVVSSQCGSAQAIVAVWQIHSCVGFSRASFFAPSVRNVFSLLMLLLFNGVSSWWRGHVGSEHPPHSVYCLHRVVGRFNLLRASGIIMPEACKTWPRFVHGCWRMDCLVSLSDMS